MVADAVNVRLEFSQLADNEIKSYWREWVRKLCKLCCMLLCTLHLLLLSRLPGLLKAPHSPAAVPAILAA